MIAMAINAVTRLASQTSDLSTYHFVFAIVVCTAVYSIYTVCYRLYCHPLAQFPGPKMAAATQLYEMYFDIIKGGQYIWEIKRLHKIYGPIVRVTPDELHIIDPDFLDNIYAGWGRPRDKMHFHVSNIPNTLFGAEFHADHRRRRNVFSSFFTKASIRKLEPFIMAKTSRLIGRLEEHMKEDRVVNLTFALFGWACDTISYICFGQDWQHIEHPTFNHEFATATLKLLQSLKVLTHAKWLMRLATAIPPRVIKMVSKQMAAPLAYKPFIKKVVLATVESDCCPVPASASKSAPTNVLSHVHQDAAVPPDLKTAEQLSRDAELLVGAGEGTVSAVVQHTFTYLHLFPRTLRRVQTELAVAAVALGKEHEHLNWAELERLPYLTACIKEGLRLQHGLTKRMPRIASTEDLHYGDVVIPRGTPMSTMAPLIHLNPDVFAQPDDFIPERWLEDKQLKLLNAQAETAGMERDEFQPPRLRSISYMSSKIMTFSRGSRVCLGMTLAWAEMYLCLSAMLRTFDFELYDTDLRDVVMVADKVVPTYRPDSKGIQARILRRHSVEFMPRNRCTC